jgi:hypothetical protein
MAIAVVNGYFCATSCDAAKAKKGQDPHPSNDPGSVDGNNNSPRADNPAVVFGGSLRNTLQTYAVTATSATQPDDPAAAPHGIGDRYPGLRSRARSNIA